MCMYSANKELQTNFTEDSIGQVKVVRLYYEASEVTTQARTMYEAPKETCSKLSAAEKMIRYDQADV